MNNGSMQSSNARMCQSHVEQGKICSWRGLQGVLRKWALNKLRPFLHLLCCALLGIGVMALTSTHAVADCSVGSKDDDDCDEEDDGGYEDHEYDEDDDFDDDDFDDEEIEEVVVYGEREEFDEDSWESNLEEEEEADDSISEEEDEDAGEEEDDKTVRANPKYIEEILVVARRLDSALKKFPPPPENWVEFEIVFIPFTGDYVVVPKSPEAGYYAGRCAARLDALPFRTSTLRHDNLESFEVKNDSSFSATFAGRSQERSSGFYAVSMVEAIGAARDYLQRNITRYVPGYHEHRNTSSFLCVPKPVDEQEFYAIRSEASALVWTQYHLLLKNCLHWAATVTGEI